MSNEEKALRMMFAKPMLEDTIRKMLDGVETVARKVNIEYPEFLLAFMMDMFCTTLKTVKTAGYGCDLDGFLMALKAEVYGDDED